jgi:hypothetical protein
VATYFRRSEVIVGASAVPIGSRGLSLIQKGGRLLLTSPKKGPVLEFPLGSIALKDKAGKLRSVYMPAPARELRR